MNEVVNGDSLDELVLFPDEYFDALVTDPPCGIDLRKMHWDSSYGGREGWVEAHRQIFTEVLRVLKPGAYGLAWAIPRTQHWTALALENAGFEIRDVVQHVYGSGFPKGEALDKRIDKRLGVFDQRPETGETKQVIDYGDDAAGGYPVLGASKTKTGTKQVPITSPASEVGRRFEGWQTNLKPAAEPWILVRKPHKTSDAQNVIDQGTGALNALGCGIDGRWASNFVASHAPDCEDERCAPGCPVLDLGKSARYFPIFRYSPKPGAKERRAAGQNNHPTLKGLDLMRWLVKLVTPPGGRVLDVFGGSGTTGVAAIMEGRQVVLIEREPEFADICRRRIALAEAEMGEDLLL